MDITGRVHSIGETQNVTDKFKKREIVVIYAENPSYPEHIKFEFQQDKVTELDKIAVGDTVELGFNLRGRLWNNKENVEVCFNTLVGWKINKVAGRTFAEQVAETQVTSPGNAEDDKDLPF